MVVKLANTSKSNNSQVLNEHLSENVVVCEMVNTSVPVKVYRRRYVILLLYGLLSFLLGFLWLTYTPVIEISADFYSTTEENMDFFSQIFFIVFIPGIFIVNAFIRLCGVRLAYLLGCVCILAGSWLRYFADQTFWLALLGQGLVAAALVLTYSLPPQIAADWFPEQERILATCVCVVCSQVGSALGAFFPGQLVSDGGTLGDLLLYEAIITSVIALPNIIIFRSRAPTPPSLSTKKKLVEIRELSPLEEAKLLLHNKRYVMLYLVEGVLVGSYVTMLSIGHRVLHDIDSSSTVGNISTVLQLAGIPGVLLLFPVLAKFKRYKQALISVNAFVLVSMCAFCISVFYVHIPSIYCTSVLVGLFWYASIPLLYEFAAELSYPVSECTSSGFLNQSMYIFALGITFTLQTSKKTSNRDRSKSKDRKGDRKTGKKSTDSKKSSSKKGAKGSTSAEEETDGAFTFILETMGQDKRLSGAGGPPRHAVSKAKLKQVIQRSKARYQQEWQEALYPQRYHDQSSSEAIIEREGYRKGPCQSSPQILSYPQEGSFQVATNTGGSRSQRAVRKSKVSHGRLEGSETITAPGGRDHHSGCLQSLQSSADRRGPTPVSGVPNRQPDLPLSSGRHGVESRSIPMDTTNESGHQWLTGARHSHRLSTRRLWRLRPPSSDPQTQGHGDRPTAVTWAHYLSQEQSSTVQSEGISGYDHRQQRNVHLSTPPEGAQSSPGIAVNGPAPLSSCSRSSEGGRQTSKFQWRNGGRQTEVSTSTQVHGQSFSTPKSMGRSNPHDTGPSGRTSEVERMDAYRDLSQDSARGFAQATSHLDGQQLLRLGLGNVGRHSESRSLQCNRAGFSHQCKGSSRSAICTTEPVHNRLSDSCSHRQSGLDCSSPQGLLNPQSGSQQDCRDDSIPLESQKTPIDSHLHSVQGQHMGRPAEPQVQFPGLAIESSLLPVDRSALRDTNGRCFRLPDQPLCPKMVLETPGTRVSGNQCSGAGLVGRTPLLRKRPLGPDTSDLEESPSLTEHTTGDLSSSRMENQSMVADSTAVATREDRASPGTGSVSPRVHCARHRSGLPALADLDSAIERRAVAELAQFFDSSLAASTKRQYQSIWLRFEQWLASNGFSSKPSPEIVAFYLYQLLLTGKYSASTLKNKFIELKRGLPKSVRGSETLTMMLKCIEKFGKPPSTSSVNMDVSSVWQKLVDTSIDFHSVPGPNATWKSFALHTVFMVGLCNAARANCLSQVDASLIVKHDNRYVLPVGNVPQKGCAASKFGKQKSLASKATKPPRQLEVYDCPHLPMHLNPYKLLEQYLASTSQWRQLYGNDILFWTLRPTKGPKGDRTSHHRAVSSPTISGWITQTLTTLGVKRVDGSQCKGHDLRRLAISLFLRAGYSPEQVKEFLQLSSSELVVQVYAQLRLHELQASNPSEVVLSGFDG
eukprot:Nk52_evm85s352 gene=Nk52_evmTU85s352